MRSEELFFALDKNVKFDFEKSPFWWPKSGSFWVVVGAILTQNTKWQNVDISLENLKNFGVKNLGDIAKMPLETLTGLIKPSGFYNQKSQRLSNLAKNIIENFGDFENFARSVSREWLISQKGLGFESVDSILCYGAGREIMVVDRYTMRIFAFLGYEFESYDEAREWLESVDFGEIFSKTKIKSENEFFARYHGVIVEFCKAHFKAGNFDDISQKILKNLL